MLLSVYIESHVALLGVVCFIMMIAFPAGVIVRLCCIKVVAIFSSNNSDNLWSTIFPGMVSLIVLEIVDGGGVDGAMTALAAAIVEDLQHRAARDFKVCSEIAGLQLSLAILLQGAGQCRAMSSSSVIG